MEELLTPDNIQYILERLAILNEDYTNLAIDVGILKAQMSMVLKLQWAVLIIVIGFVVSKVLIKVFNHKDK